MKSAKQIKAERRSKRRNFKFLQKTQQTIKKLYYESLGNAHENIYHMSEDLWVNILSYLPTVNVLRFRFVSRLFNYLLSNPRHIHASELAIHMFNDLTSKQVNQRVKVNPFTRIIPLEQLELYHARLYRRVDFGSEYCRVLERKGMVRSLNSGLEFERQAMILTSLAYYIPNLTQYDETGGTIDMCIGAQVHSVMSQETLINLIMAHGQHIEELVLNGCDAVTDFLVQIIVNKCAKLKRLELRSCMNITDVSRLCVVHSPVLRQTLQYCDFSESPLAKMPDDSSILHYLRGFLNLKRIVWSEADYYADILMDLMEQADKELDKDLLQSIRQRRNTISDKSANPLEVQEIMKTKYFRPLPQDPTKLYHLYNTVESLHLESNNYFNLSSAYLPALTQKFKNLEEIQLYFCGQHHIFNIDDRFMRRCWNESKKNTKLKHLAIEGYYYDGDGSYPLREFLSLYPGLESFTYLLGVNFNEGDMSHFFKQHPNLQSFQCDCMKLEDLAGAEKEVGSKFEKLRVKINMPPFEPLSVREERAQHLYDFLTTVGPQLQELEIKIDTSSESNPLPFGNEIVRIIGSYCTNLKVLALENLMFKTSNSFIKKISSRLQRLTLSKVVCLHESTSDPVEDEVGPSALQSLTMLKCDSVVCDQLPTRLPSLKYIAIFDGKVTQEQFDRLISPENAPHIHSIAADGKLDTVSKVVEYTKEYPTIALRLLCCPMTTTSTMEQIIRKAGVGLQTLSVNFSDKENASSIGVQLIKTCRHLRYLNCPTKMEKYEELGKEFGAHPWKHIWKLYVNSWKHVVGDYYNLWNHPEREIHIS